MLHLVEHAFLCSLCSFSFNNVKKIIFTLFLYLFSSRSVLFPTNIIRTSSPRSAFTSVIHFDVCSNDSAPETCFMNLSLRFFCRNYMVQFSINNTQYLFGGQTDRRTAAIIISLVGSQWINLGPPVLYS